MAGQRRRHITIGVDPGASGAFALLCGPSLFIFEMPSQLVRVGKTDRLRVDPPAIHTVAQALSLNAPDVAILEAVQGFGKQDAAGAFVFGRAVGLVEMAIIAAGVPVEGVTPQRWKKALGLGKDKSLAVDMATRLFPESARLFQSGRGKRRKAQAEGNAEAALLAFYGAMNA